MLSLVGALGEVRLETDELYRKHPTAVMVAVMTMRSMKAQAKHRMISHSQTARGQMF